MHRGHLGYDYLHVAVDDASRLAFVAVYLSGDYS